MQRGKSDILPTPVEINESQDETQIILRFNIKFDNEAYRYDSINIIIAEKLKKNDIDEILLEIFKFLKREGLISTQDIPIKFVPEIGD